MPKYLGQPLTGPSLVGLSVSSGLHCCQHLPPPRAEVRKRSQTLFFSHITLLWSRSLNLQLKYNKISHWENCGLVTPGLLDCKNTLFRASDVI